MSSLFVLSFALLLHIVIAVDPLYHFCSNSDQNFTTNSPYQKNRDKVLGDLYFKTPPTGFGLSSRGQYDQDRAFGLSLCRGDVSAQDCKACVVDASSEIHKRCPYNKGAAIYYDNCLLKYSNIDFYGKIDNQNTFYMLNVKSVNDSESSFNKKTRALLRHLSEEAFTAPKMYATGESELELELEGAQKLYGLVQCTRDLSGVDCKKCLDDAVSQLQTVVREN